MKGMATLGETGIPTGAWLVCEDRLLVMVPVR